MKKLMKAVSLLLAGCMLLGISGCSQVKKKADEPEKQEVKQEKKSEYHMYYLSLTESKLEMTDYIPKERTTEAMIGEIIEKLQEVPDSEEYSRLLPKKVKIKDYAYEGQTVTVNFDEDYQKMKNTREILARAGVVKALTQIPGVTYVVFWQNGEPMKDSDGMVIAPMDKDTFVENNGENINSYVSSNLNLYFANAAGDRLVKETVWVHYNSSVPLERKIVERLLKGPSSGNPDLKPTLSPNTKILSVSIVEGICYVNLDKTFLEESQDVQEKLPIYSIVNSLTDACKILGVQISVGGETKVTFRESMKLDKMYQADYSLVEDPEAEEEENKNEEKNETAETGTENNEAESADDGTD